MDYENIIRNLYTQGHHYLMMWYPEISLEDYHKWFVNFDFSNAGDNLEDLSQAWAYITYKHFVLKENELIVYNMYIDGLKFIKQYKNISKLEFVRWFGRIIHGRNLEKFKYVFFENILYNFVNKNRQKLIDILYRIGRILAVDHLNISIKKYNKFFSEYEFPYTKVEMQLLSNIWGNLIYLKFNKNVIFKRRK